MESDIEIAIPLSTTLLEAIDRLAQQRGIARNSVIELALRDYIGSQPPENPPQATRQVINQGDIYWVQLHNGDGSALGVPHPHVIIQENILNHSRISTVVTCALTTNPQRVALPGNILLEPGEANLPRRSVIEVSKVSTVEKSQLGDYIGTLDVRRIEQIRAGLHFLQTAF